MQMIIDVPTIVRLLRVHANLRIWSPTTITPGTTIYQGRKNVAIEMSSIVPSRTLQTVKC